MAACLAALSFVTNLDAGPSFAQSAVKSTVTSAKTRTVKFPTTGRWAIGQLYAGRMEPTSEPAWNKLKHLGAARGNIVVPTDTSLCLIVSPEGVEILSELGSLCGNDLQIIKFTGTEVRSADLKHITAQKSLKFLDCSGTDIDGSAIATLAALPQLAALNLSRTELKDAGMADLPKLRALQYLTVHHNRVTDAGVVSLPSCKSLTHLNIRETQLTDKSCASLSKLAKVSELNIAHTSITDNGLQELAKMKSLKHVTLTMGGITETGIARFKKAAPQCSVFVHKRKRDTF